MTDVDVDVLERLLEKATPGPWENGDPYGWAGVMPERFGEGQCALCAAHGEPIWTGRQNINGRRMQAHLHRRIDDAWQPDHEIVARPKPGETVMVAGNYDYEAGGICQGEDARLIVALRNAAPALLAHVKRLERVAEAARPLTQQWPADTSLLIPLRAALSDLEESGDGQ